MASGPTARDRSRKRPRIHLSALFAALVAGMAAPAGAAEITVTLHEATNEGVGSPIGQVRFEDSAHGLLIRPDLKNLEPGPHGFHVHENADCGPATRDGEVIPVGAAGGHYDPEKTGRYEGPYGTGALGDLPNLIAEQDGTVTIATLAPRLEVQDVRGRAVVIHGGPDRYGEGHSGHHHDDKSARRVACGIIP